MSGSFTWNAIVRVGSISRYEKATVITVLHEYKKKDAAGSLKTHPCWNSVISFNDRMRTLLEDKLSEGDLVHFTGTVRTNTFQTETDEKRRTVDLVISSFDLLQRHIEGPTD